MSAAAAALKQTRQAMFFKRLLNEAEALQPVRRISIQTDPPTLSEFIGGGEGERLLALQMGEERQTVEPLKHPTVGSILLLARIGLAACEEPPLPLQEQQLGVRT